MLHLLKHNVTDKDLAFAVLALAVFLIAVAFIGSLIKRSRQDYYERRWKELQAMLGKKASWIDAVVAADDLLDELLKKRHFKGKTMGERLVAAQHHLTANDLVWYSHKFKNKLTVGEATATKTEVKKCLLGFWQALKDLGAFKR